ncbi:MAG: class I SAM-dependent methyltransferase [Elusimicrobiota bacterium]
MTRPDRMERVLEPELMSDPNQAVAYANADFEESHSRAIELLDAEFQRPRIDGSILDLGCGPGDITFRLARRFPEASIAAVDGSAAMIELANMRKERENDMGGNITFLEGRIPTAAIPRASYDLIVSTSFLHHLPDPAVLWDTIIEHARPGCRVFVYDLFRPGSKEEARRLVDRYSGGEPDVLKRDFYHSLLAAFEPKEVERQLVAAGLPGFSIKTVSDRHMIMFGVKA